MLHTGDTYRLAVRFTQDDVIAFAEVTGDRNPIHLDADYAAHTPFGRPIVHGFLSSAVFSRVFGTLFPGEGTIYLAQEMSFRAPVFVDEDYEAEFVITEIRTDRHIATVACTLRHVEDGRECITGTAKLKHDKAFI